MSTQFSRVEAIFSAAAEILEPEKQRDYLDQQCGADSQLRRRVDDLLKAHAHKGTSLDEPPAVLELTPEEDKSPPATNWIPPLLKPCSKPGRLGTLRGDNGDYEVIEIVGEGGMAAVLRAFETKLERVVAVKLMKPAVVASDPMAIKRFIREARACAAIHNDHVVIIHNVEDKQVPPFLVMEFIKGETLEQRIQREKSLAPRLIMQMGIQIASGLAAAHEAGLIHRDLKPGNILLENHVARVKITDFGLARPVNDQKLTREGFIAGTPNYMSPEQAEGRREIDHRSDLFSLGGVLYTMCTGVPPFHADGSVAVVVRVCNGEPDPIQQLNPAIPSELQQVVMKLLEKNPDDRYQTAEEVVADLEALLKGGKPMPRRTERFPGWAKVLIAAVLLMALISAGSRWLLRKPQLNVKWKDPENAVLHVEWSEVPTFNSPYFWLELEAGASYPQFPIHDSAGSNDALDVPERMTQYFVAPLPPGANFDQLKTTGLPPEEAPQKSTPSKPIPPKSSFSEGE